MNIHDRLFVEIHPLESGQIPHPHPVTEARFDPALVYKVLGMYNASETSECYFVLVNPQRQIWFIPQRHLLAYGLVDSNEFFLTRSAADQLRGDGASNRQSLLASVPTNGTSSHNGASEHVTLSSSPVPADQNGSLAHAGGHAAKNGHSDLVPLVTRDRHSGF